MPPPTDNSADADDPVQALLRERHAVQGWLHRLDEHEGEIPERVVERVRADYRDRLARVIDALASHETHLREELERQRTELLGARTGLDRALDEVAEGQLRHLIGELSAEDWEARRPGLEGAVESARERTGLAEREVERLEEIFAQIEAQAEAAPPAPPAGPAGRTAAVPPIDPPAPEPGPVPPPRPEGSTASGPGPETEPWEPLPPEYATLEEPASASSGWAPFDEPLPGPLPADEQEDPGEMEFLEQLDRAISSTGGDAPDGSAPWDDEPPSTPPGPGIKCSECGYTNDPTAWYCGVCGADLS